MRDKLSEILHRPGPFNDLLGKVEQKTGLDRILVLGAASGLVALNLCVGYAAQLVCGVIGFLYPAYQSVKALNQTDKEVEKRWLTYWVVFSFFHVLEFFSDHLVWWLPFYWLVKTKLLLWCMAPISNNGSVVIYSRVIRPLYAKYHSDIDTAFVSASDLLGKAADKVKEVADSNKEGLLDGAKGVIRDVAS